MHQRKPCIRDVVRRFDSKTKKRILSLLSYTRNRCVREQLLRVEKIVQLSLASTRHKSVPFSFERCFKGQILLSEVRKLEHDQANPHACGGNFRVPAGAESVGTYVLHSVQLARTSLYFRLICLASLVPSVVQFRDCSYRRMVLREEPFPIFASAAVLKLNALTLFPNLCNLNFPSLPSLNCQLTHPF